MSGAAQFLRYYAKREQHLREARTDVNAFCEYVFSDDLTGNAWVQARMQREWQEDLDRFHKLLIIAPRLHAKTGQVALARPLWTLGNNVESLVKIICQSDKKAVKRLSALRAHIKDNDALHRVFPHLSEGNLVDDNKHMVKFTRRSRSPDPSIEALGITSSASGDRATHLIFDDACDRRNAITLPRVRKQIIEAFDDWMNLLPPDGWLWYIATLWHKQDLTHKLMANPEFAVAWYQLDLNDFSSFIRRPDGTERYDEKPLWTPEEGGRWSKESLADRKRAIGPRKFARGFSNQPLLDEEQRIKPEWIRYWRKAPTTAWPRILSIDLASTRGDKSDWTGVAVLAVRPDVAADQPDIDTRGAVKVIDAFHAKLSFPAKVDLIRALRRRYKPFALVIERASGGVELAEHLTSTYGYPVDMIKPRGSKGDRLDRVSPLVSSGVVELNPGLDPLEGLRTDDTGDLVGELTGFPLTEDDDVLDAFVHALRFCQLRWDCLQPALGEGEAQPRTPELTRVTII